MGGPVDGTYSIVASAIAGSSIGVCTIVDGVINAIDIAGVRYKGNVAVEGSSARIRLKATIPPTVFGIWGTEPMDTFHTREADLEIPASRFSDGQPVRVNDYEMWLIIRRIPDNWAPLAGPAALPLVIGTLQEVQRAWTDFDSRS